MFAINESGGTVQYNIISNMGTLAGAALLATRETRQADRVLLADANGALGLAQCVHAEAHGRSHGSSHAQGHEEGHDEEEEAAG